MCDHHNYRSTSIDFCTVHNKKERVSNETCISFAHEYSWISYNPINAMIAHIHDNCIGVCIGVLFEVSQYCVSAGLPAYIAAHNHVL